MKEYKEISTRYTSMNIIFRPNHIPGSEYLEKAMTRQSFSLVDGEASNWYVKVNDHFPFPSWADFEIAKGKI